MLDCLGEIIRMMGMKNHDFGTGITLDSDHDIQSQSQMEHNNWSPEGVFRLVNPRQFFVKDKRFKQK